MGLASLVSSKSIFSTRLRSICGDLRRSKPSRKRGSKARTPCSSVGRWRVQPEFWEVGAAILNDDDRAIEDGPLDWESKLSARRWKRLAQSWPLRVKIFTL